MIIPPQVASIVGLAIIGHIGSNILVSISGKNNAIYLSLLLDIAAASVTLKWIWGKAEEIAHVFGIFL